MEKGTVASRWMMSEGGERCEPLSSGLVRRWWFCAPGSFEESLVVVVSTPLSLSLAALLSLNMNYPSLHLYPPAHSFARQFPHLHYIPAPLASPRFYPLSRL